MPRTKGEVPKSTRNRTPEQDALLNEVRKYEAVVKFCTAQTNQIHAMCRMGLIDKDEEAQYVADMIKPMKSHATKHINKLAKGLKELPLWTSWLKNIRGIGPNLAIQFIANIQPIADFDTPSKLWAYCGMHTVDGKAARRQAGKKSNWNPRLKTLTWQAGECFEKQGHSYRELYDRYKAKDKERHPEPVKTKDKDRFGEPITLYRPAHLRERAKRFAAKIFLAHLWQVWRELEELPGRTPYPIEHLGHTTVLDPWEFMGRDMAAVDTDAA